MRFLHVALAFVVFLAAAFVPSLEAAAAPGHHLKPNSLNLLVLDPPGTTDAWATSFCWNNATGTAVADVTNYFGNGSNESSIASGFYAGATSPPYSTAYICFTRAPANPARPHINSANLASLCNATPACPALQSAGCNPSCGLAISVFQYGQIETYNATIDFTSITSLAAANTALTNALNAATTQIGTSTACRQARREGGAAGCPSQARPSHSP